MKKTLYFPNGNCAPQVTAILSVLFLFCIVSSNTFADNVITNGTKVKVLSGTNSVSVGNLVIKSGATLTNTGMLILQKNLVNENAGTNPIGTGTVKLMGTSVQNITGQNTIQNLIISNASGVTIGGNTNVNGTLTLTSGKVNLGNYNLLLGPSALISGTPTSAKMIIVTATGQLRKNFPSGYTGSFIFPVGDNTGTAEYSPVTLNFSGGTFGAGNYVGVTLRNSKYPDPLIAGNYLNRYWSISQSGITNLSCNAVFQYVPADIVGNESIISCMRITPTPVITYGLANTVTHQLTANGITSFGTYTGGTQSGYSPALTGPTQVCVNSSGNVYTTDAGKSNYVWVVSPGGTITAGGTSTNNTITITWNTTGTQNVSVNYNGSSNPTVLNVTVNPLPVPTITGPASICVGTTGVTYTTQTGMSAYTWTISAGGTITAGAGTNIITITWSTAGNNYVKVNYQNSSGCFASSATMKSVYVSALPVPVLNGSLNVCLNNTITYSTTSGQANYVWAVSPGGTITAGGGTTNYSVTVKWIATGVQTISVSYTNTYGCTAVSPTVKNVTVNPVPSPTITGPSPVCIGSSGIVYNTEPGMTGYTWTISSGGTITAGGGTNAITVSWITAGSKYVKVNYQNSSGCYATTATTKAVYVSSLPVPVITGPVSVNVNTTSQYNTTAGMNNYTWTVSSGGTITSGGGSGDSWVKILWSVAGTQSVSVNYTNAYGCSAPAPTIYNVTVNPLRLSPGSDPITNDGVDITDDLSEPLNKDLLPEFSVYPVPNDGRFTISITSPIKENYTINIVNYLGVEVYHRKDLTVLGIQKQEVDISSVTEGVYLVIVRNDKNQAIRRILIRK